MPLAAFILGLLSLTVALLALGWNIGAWLMSAGRARCLLLIGISNGQSIVFAPVEKSGYVDPERIDRLADQGFGFGGPKLLGVEVHNIGRSPLVVSRYEAVIEPKSVSLSPMAGSLGPALPYSIAPGDSAQWWISMNEIGATAKSATGVLVDEVTGVHMQVTTALRKEVRTKTSLRFGQRRPSQTSSSAAETTEPGPPAAS